MAINVCDVTAGHFGLWTFLEEDLAPPPRTELQIYQHAARQKERFEVSSNNINRKGNSKQLSSITFWLLFFFTKLNIWKLLAMSLLAFSVGSIKNPVLEFENNLGGLEICRSEKIGLSYHAVHRLAESLPWNLFLFSLQVSRYHLSSISFWWGTVLYTVWKGVLTKRITKNNFFLI